MAKVLRIMLLIVVAFSLAAGCTKVTIKTKKDEPPGWDKGKKTGWGDGDKPPGLEKKHDNDYDDDKNGKGNKNGKNHKNDKD